MTRLCEVLRVKEGRSKIWVADEAQLPPSMVGWIERGRWIPYPVQLARLAAALGYVGRPEDLLKDVGDLLTEVLRA